MKDYEALKAVVQSSSGRDAYARCESLLARVPNEYVFLLIYSLSPLQSCQNHSFFYYYYCYYSV
jgi:hypothetical protein